MLTDTLYDSRGLTYLTRAAYYNNAAAPGTTLLLSDDNQVPSATRVQFDGAERPVVSAYLKLNVEQWRTTTTYGGDHVDVTPPAGGTATSTFTDARGQITALHQYHAPTPTGPPDLGSTGALLLQLEDATTLRVEGRPGTTTCAAEQPWAFGAAAFTYRR